MKKGLVFLFAIVMLTPIARPFPLFAQGAAPTAQPEPLKDALWEALIGEWEGWSETPNGKFQERVELEWELHKQFLKTNFSSKATDGTTYKSTGFSTIDPATGKISGYWFDSNRAVFKSTETRAGNQFTIKFEGPVTVERTYEKVSGDKLVGTIKAIDTSGKMTEGRTELTRKVKKEKK